MYAVKWGQRIGEAIGTAVGAEGMIKYGGGSSRVAFCVMVENFNQEIISTEFSS